MKLRYQIIEVTNISDDQKQGMFRLLEAHYTNTTWNNFLNDLSEKRWVILLYTCDTNQIAGFSTQMLINPEESDIFENSLVLYSGDTIIAREYWGSVALPVAFLDLATQIKANNSGKKLYWMLISKGLRTYKFLSVFLKEYYPNPFADTPESVRLMINFLADRKFGQKYNPAKGVIEAEPNGQFLKDAFQPEEKNTKLVAKFFYRKNPGYQKGDELVCLAEISDENLHPFIKRVANSYEL